MDHTGLTDQLNYPKQVRPHGGLFSMVKDADGTQVRSDGAWNKYDPELIWLTTTTRILPGKPSYFVLPLQLNHSISNVETNF